MLEKITSEWLDEQLRKVQYKVNPNAAGLYELPAGARGAIVAQLLPALRDLAKQQ